MPQKVFFLYVPLFPSHFLIFCFCFGQRKRKLLSGMFESTIDDVLWDSLDVNSVSSDASWRKRVSLSVINVRLRDDDGQVAGTGGLYRRHPHRPMTRCFCCCCCCTVAVKAIVALQKVMKMIASDLQLWPQRGWKEEEEENERID